MVSAPKSRGLYGDFNDRYFEIKNSNKQTSEFLAFLFVLMQYVFLVVFAVLARFQRVLVLLLFSLYIINVFFFCFFFFTS